MTGIIPENSHSSLEQGLPVPPRSPQILAANRTFFVGVPRVFVGEQCVLNPSKPWKATRPDKHKKIYWKRPNRNSGFTHWKSMVGSFHSYVSSLPEANMIQLCMATQSVQKFFQQWFQKPSQIAWDMVSLRFFQVLLWALKWCYKNKHGDCEGWVPSLHSLHVSLWFHPTDPLLTRPKRCSSQWE